MDSNKVPASTSATLPAAVSTVGSAASVAASQLFDPVAFQTACFAAQLQSQLQHQQNNQLAAPAGPASSATSTVTPSCLPAVLDSERIYSLLPPQVQSCLQQQQQQQQQRSFLLQQQQNGASSVTHHFSAFSPISTMDLPSASLGSSTHSPPSSHHSLDLLLIQMQMAAAAAGFLPAAFNVLSPAAAAAAALGLLAPQFRLPQLSDPNFSPYAAAAAAHLGLSAAISTTADDATTSNNETSPSIERTLLQAQMNLLTAGGSGGAGHAVGSSALSTTTLNGESSSRPNSSLNYNSSPSCSKQQQQQQQQRSQMKRPYNEMSILRSLCNENCSSAEEPTVSRKRSRAAADESEQQRVRQKSTKAHLNSGKSLHEQRLVPATATNKQMPAMEQLTENSKTAADQKLRESFFDENSPNRHHPLNHRPPAMEARFLECMAAIALHSNIPLPIDDESTTKTRLSESTNAAVEPEENGGGDREKRAKEYAVMNVVSEELKISQNSEVRSSSLCQPKSSSGSATKESATNTNGNERCYDKKWPVSAIDDELCQQLENYKDSNVPVIHAFVLPSKLPIPGSPIVSDDKNADETSCLVAPSSVAVPIPVLNILLDRILLTMLDS
ncbi:unnamed protein product [Gongylonema pulchrum]|uniref:POU domain protein n=1 Tax=Gongylonema pulchrum TaxID=637853 RepID=A0A183DP79_9BILA|nr:unnamed protein product [Gongylonema pulchrum]